MASILQQNAVSAWVPKMHGRRRIVVLSLALIASAAAAHADTRTPAAPAATDRSPIDPWQRHAVLVSFGLGSPVGYAGVVYATPALGRFWLQAGVGLGWSGGLLSTMPKFAIYKGHACRIGIGVGGGLGMSALAAAEQPGPISAWLDVDLFHLECRRASRDVLSFGLGFTKRLSEPIPADTRHDMPDPGDGLPQLHFGFGVGF